MDYRKLRYFTAVAEGRSIHQASEALRVSQPALTRAIKELELELGTRLFARHSRGVDLTREGAVLLAHAKRLMRELEMARNAVMALGAQPRGLVSVGVPPTLSVLLLASVAEQTAAKWPDIVLNFHERLMPDLLGMITADRLDIAIVGNPRPTPGVTLTHLVDEEVVLVADRRFSLPPTLDKDALPNYPLIVSGSSMDTFSWFEQAVQDPTILQSTRVRVDNPKLSITLAKSGLGCSVLPRSSIADIEADHGLHIASIEGITLKRYLAVNAARAENLAVGAVLDVVRDEFAALILRGVFGGR